MNRDQIRSFIKEHGVEGFRKGFAALVDGHKLPNGTVKKLDRDKFSFKELWEGCVGGVSETFDNAYWRETTGGAALDHTGFPTATEKLLSSVVIDAYNARPGIADALVPRSFVPKTLTERMLGFTSAEAPKNVMPGEVYPRTSISEKYATFEQALHNKKEGVEIAITEEVIRFDQTNQIMDVAFQIGDGLQTEKERRTVRAVMGIGEDIGTAQSNVYFPSGVDTPVYASSSSNLRTNAAPIYNHPGKTADSKLEDYTDIQEVMATHAQNIKDDRQLTTQRPISWMPNTLLLPTTLATTANNIFQSQGIMYRANDGSTTTPQITHNAPNPLSVLFRGAFPVPLTSVYVDEVSSTMWIMYDNQKTFVRAIIFPFATFRAPVGYGWSADVPFALRVREWTRVIAKDNKHAIRNNGA